MYFALARVELVWGSQKWTVFYLNFIGALILHVAVGRSAFLPCDYIGIWKETMLTCWELLSQTSPVETEVNQEELNGMPATG
jgi:hypothetical protein